MSFVQKKYDPMAFIPDPEPEESVVEQPSVNLTTTKAVSSSTAPVPTVPKPAQSKVSAPGANVPKVTVPTSVRVFQCICLQS